MYRTPVRPSITFCWHPELVEFVGVSELEPYLAKGWYVDGDTLRRPLPTTPRFPDDVPRAPHLPTELWHLILSHLPISDLIASTQCSRHFSILSRWFILHRLKCGLERRRIAIVDESKIPSLIRFASNWGSRNRRFLYRFLPLYKSEIPVFEHVVLGNKLSADELEEAYAGLDNDTQNLAWTLLPHPVFVRTDIKSWRHPVKILIKVMRVLLREDKNPQSRLSAAEMNELHALARELYQSCWYVFCHHTDITPAQFALDKYEEILELIPEDELNDG